jgi:ribonucleotide reductase beta subunit family protein with ferritin-like domain
MAIRLLTPKETYTVDYPVAIEFARKQQEIMWFDFEIEVEKDLHDIRTNFNEAELYGLTSTLKLFTKYEISVNEYWKNYVSQVFPRPDIQRMADAFAFMETNVHAPFYNKINQVLGLDTDEFYLSYLDDEVLVNRMKWIGKRLSKRETLMDKLKSVGIFSMVEGAVLFGQFAFIKHFNSNGKNKAINVNAGINFSAIDESLHSQGGAWLFRTLLSEAKADGQINEEDEAHLRSELEETARVIREHDGFINGKTFERGHIKGVTETQLNNFTESRLDMCLKQLGYKSIFKPSWNPIAEWFYKDLESTTLHDFFSSTGSDYNRNWKEARFVW